MQDKRLRESLEKIGIIYAGNTPSFRGLYLLKDMHRLESLIAAITDHLGLEVVEGISVRKKTK